MIHRAFSFVLLGSALVLLVHGERFKATGTLDGDPFSLYAVVIILASLSLSRGTVRVYFISLALILVVSTRNLLLVALGMASVAAILAGRRTYRTLVLSVPLVVPLVAMGHIDLARLADPSPLGLAVFLAGLLATWFSIHRSVVKRDTYLPGESVHLSFAALVAVIVALVRIDAWLPDLASVERLLGLGGNVFLGLGALGVFFAGDRRNLVRWGLVAEAGLLSAFCLGGVQARPFVLAQLVLAGVAIHLAARARDRLTLAVGALALVSPPPFPGFPFTIAAASAVIAEGHASALLAALPAYVVLGLGAIRYAWRHSEPRDSELDERPIEIAEATPLGAALAAAAVLLLGVWSQPLIELARLAASGLF